MPAPLLIRNSEILIIMHEKIPMVPSHRPDVPRARATPHFPIFAGRKKMGRLYDGRRDRPVAWWQI